jgi:uncharacterized membrane protein YesL
MNPWEERFPRLWAFGERVAVVVVGTLMFYLFSALIITIPAAVAGLFAGVALLIRPSGGEVIGRFWRGFRRSFGRALVLGLLDLIMGFAVWFYYTLFRSFGSTAGTVGQVVALSVGVVAAVASVYAWSLLAWFPQPLGKLLKRALMLGAAHPFPVLGGMVGVLALLILWWLLPGGMKSLVVILGPGLSAYCLGAGAWRGMKRYAGPDDEFAE